MSTKAPDSVQDPGSDVTPIPLLPDSAVLDPGYGNQGGQGSSSQVSASSSLAGTAGSLAGAAYGPTLAGAGSSSSDPFSWFIDWQGPALLVTGGSTSVSTDDLNTLASSLTTVADCLDRAKSYLSQERLDVSTLPTPPPPACRPPSVSVPVPAPPWGPGPLPGP